MENHGIGIIIQTKKIDIYGILHLLTMIEIGLIVLNQCGIIIIHGLQEINIKIFMFMLNQLSKNILKLKDFKIISHGLNGKELKKCHQLKPIGVLINHYIIVIILLNFLLILMVFGLHMIEKLKFHNFIPNQLEDGLELLMVI